ncbi:1350_t:CDS:2 [Funneliformis geosporum]|nr:1350_t:CDS:2 [Funneliformis geosporum]
MIQYVENEQQEELCCVLLTNVDKGKKWRGDLLALLFGKISQLGTIFNTRDKN